MKNALLAGCVLLSASAVPALADWEFNGWAVEPLSVNMMFGLAIGSVSVSLGVSILLFDNLIRGGGYNSYFLFGFVSPLILFQAIALFFIRTSMNLQDGLDRKRKELTSIESLMASASPFSDRSATHLPPCPRYPSACLGIGSSHQLARSQRWPSLPASC